MVRRGHGLAAASCAIASSDLVDPSHRCIPDSTPVPAVVEASCGHSHTVARTSDGRLFSWGRGDSGETGSGNLTDAALPRPVRSIAGHVWRQVSAGSYYTAALAGPGFTGSFVSVADAVAPFTKRTAAMVTARDAAVAAATPVKVAAPAPAPAPAPAAAPAAAAAEGGSNDLPPGW